jgi:hypothetical protein
MATNRPLVVVLARGVWNNADDPDGVKEKAGAPERLVG